MLIIKSRKFGIKQVDEGKLPPQNDNEADVSRLILDYLVSICSDTLAEYEGAILLFLSKRYFTAGRNRDFLRIFFPEVLP